MTGDQITAIAIIVSMSLFFGFIIWRVSAVALAMERNSGEMFVEPTNTTRNQLPCCQVDNAYSPCEDEDTGDATASQQPRGIEAIRRMAAIPDPGVYCGPAEDPGADKAPNLSRVN